MALRAHPLPRRHTRGRGILMAGKLLYLVSEDWYFLSHRLPMARAARDAGYEVHVATRVVDGAERINAEGFHLHPIPWRRGSLDPFAFITTTRAVRALYRSIRPAIVHHVAFAPSVTGSVAALGLPMAKLNALAGLGFVFTSNSLKARLLRPVARAVLRFLLGRPRTMVLVQNPDDEAVVLQLGLSAGDIARIPGSGVDVDHLVPLPEPDGAFTVGFVGRLLYDKGVATLVEAHTLLQQRGLALRLLVAGTPDPSNPASIPQSVIDRWREDETMIFAGHIGDIRTVWAQSHLAVLPSRREGLPKSLLEAAACGRAMVATDVPGCREIVRESINGLLVPADDAPALADAIERLSRDAALRRQFADAARRIVCDEFSSARVGHDIVALYDRLQATDIAAQRARAVAP